MKSPFVVLGKAWLPVWLLAAICVPVFFAWVAPLNIASWSLLSAFCG